MGYIVDPSFTPFFAQGFLSALDIRNVIFMIVLIIISVGVYYPFLKFMKNTLANEEIIKWPMPLLIWRKDEKIIMMLWLLERDQQESWPAMNCI